MTINEEVIEAFRYLTGANFLLYRAIPIGLLAAGYALSFREHQRINLALVGIGSAAAVVFNLVVWLVAGDLKLTFLSVSAGVLAAGLASIGIGVLLDLACFSPWLHLSAAIPTLLSFGFLIGLANIGQQVHKFLFGNTSFLALSDDDWKVLGVSVAHISILLSLTGIALLVAMFRWRVWLPGCQGSRKARKLLSGYVSASVLATAAVLMLVVNRVLDFSVGNFPDEAFLAFCGAFAVGLRRPLLALLAGILLGMVNGALHYATSYTALRYSALNAFTPLLGVVVVLMALYLRPFAQRTQDTR